MNPYFKYQRVSATSDNKIQQMLFVFDEVIKSLYQAQKSINNNDVEGKHNNLSKVIDIFYTLHYIIDIAGGGDAAKLFNNFNIISIQKLQDINFNNSKQQDLGEIIKVVSNVRNVLQENVRCFGNFPAGYLFSR